MINSIDAKVVQVYQQIVDLTEKRPQWLARQVAIFYMIPEAMTHVIFRESIWDAVWLLFILTIAGLLVYATYDEYAFRVFGESRWARVALLSLTVGQSVVFIVTPSGRGFLTLVGGIGMLSYYGFAGCEGPRPRTRKEKLIVSPV